MPNQAGKSVLVIEGDPDTMTHLRTILESDRNHVDLAMTAAKALRVRECSRYLAVLMERRLPDANAAELLPGLRQLAPDVPEIFVSEQDDESGAIETTCPEADDFLPKPINRSELPVRLERISMHQRLEETRRESERLASAALDSLSSNIAVLDDSGMILKVNRAWRNFAPTNAEAGEKLAEGADYFQVCARATGEDAETAQAFARGIKDVISGRRPSFDLEYPCHAPGRRRWFVGRVDLVQGDGPRKVVVSHVDITDKVIAKEESRVSNAALRESADRMQVLSRRVVEVQEEERRHIARELHDEIGQVLSAISVNLHDLKGMNDSADGPLIADSISIVDQAMQQVRNLSLDLRPSILDDLGLVATLRWYADRQAQRAGFSVHFTVEWAAPRLSAELTSACFRVMQEALTNVARHARARQVWVELRQDDDEVALSIRDDGIGFDPSTVRDSAATGERVGLLGIQERAALLGGRTEIHSHPGDGTMIQAWFPMASVTWAQATPA